MNYVDVHLNDYAAATFHLTPLEDGIYWRLIRAYYRDERPLPLELEKVERLAGARSGDERAAVRAVLEEFFEETEDGYRQARCDAVILRFREKSEKATRSASARWEKTERSPNGERSESERNANAMRSDSDSNASQYPIPNTHISPTDVGDMPRGKRAAIARPETVDEKVWADFVALRKAKRAPLTATALEGIEREATKAGIALGEALRVCCLRGWQGFKAEWHLRDSNGGGVGGVGVGGGRGGGGGPGEHRNAAAHRTIFEGVFDGN